MTYPTWALSPYTRAALDALPNQVDATTAPPVIDEAIAWLKMEAQRINNEIDQTTVALHIAIDGRDSRNHKTQQWPTSERDILARAQATDPGTEVTDYYLGQHYPTIGDILTARDGLQAQLVEIGHALTPLSTQYCARRWTRVYLVDNTNGHVHSHTRCRNCYATTRYQWITEMSGATDEDVVARAGGQTCLTCYDSVRDQIVADRPCTLEGTEQRADRLVREAEAAATLAEKVAKGITPDGSPLRVRVDRETFVLKTERAAQLRYVEWAAEVRLGYLPAEQLADYRAGAETLLAALAAKRGTTLDEQRAALNVKVANKVTANRR